MKNIYPLIHPSFRNRNPFLMVLFFILSSAPLLAVPLNGNYNVGSGQTYTTLTAAITDLNTNGVSGPVTFTLTDATYSTSETFPISINTISGASATNTVRIIPSASSSGVSISSANAIATLLLNGATYVTIDGRAGGTGTTIVLNIINTNAAGVAIKITNDASFNTITYCDVQGQNTVSVPALTTAAGVIFINSASATNNNGNDKNTISYCNVHGTGTTTSTFPTVGICAYGTQTTTATYNDTCTITNCNIYDIFNATLAATHVKIDLGNTAWNITNNRFYQTTSINYGTSTAVYRALWVTPNVSNIANAANGFIITGNFIGGSNASGTGTTVMTGSSTYSYWAMDISVGLGTPTSVQNNTITNLDITTANTGSAAMEGINIANGNANVGTLAGNLVGSTTSTPGITFTATANTGGPIGYRTGGGTNNVINISNNVVGGIVVNSPVTVAGIFNGIAASGGTTVNITNNTIGSPTVPNSINITSASTSTSIQSVRGIIVNGTGTSGTVSGNLIANMNSNSVATGTQNSTMVGIAIASTAGACSVTGNIIRNLTTASATSNTGVTYPLMGISYATTTGPAIISGNRIYALTLTHAAITSATALTGIYYTGPTGSTNSIDNNLITSLSATSSDTSLTVIKAIELAGGNATIKNNMIRLGIDENGNALPKAMQLHGINESAGVNNICYNSVYIGGNASNGANNTYGFSTSLTSAARDIKNNIFANVRTNTLGSAYHYAIKLNSASGTSINANDYWTGTAFLAQNNTTNITSLGLWQLATTQDSLSVSANPKFKNPTGSSASVDLHIDTTGTSVSFLESGGMTITGISTDIDSDTRPGPAGSVKGGGVRPDIGADEFDGVPRPNCSNSTAGTVLSSADSVCYAGSVSLSLTGSTGLGVGNAYQWQSSSNGVNFTDITGATQSLYSPGGLTATTYFRCVLTCTFGASSSNSSIKKITVVNPLITSTTPGSSCGPGVVTLGATASYGTINWYASATGGVPLDTGKTFITPSLTNSAIYYVSATYNGCSSGARTAVNATIKAIPTVSSVTNNSRCGAGSVAIGASTSLGTIDWYAASTGGTSLGTGTTFNTPSISTTTTYYAEVTSLGCVSASRAAVTATIVPVPVIDSVKASGVCITGTVTLRAYSSTGTVYWYASSSGSTALDSGNTFTTPVLTSGRTYYVEAQSGACVSSTRTPVVASIYSAPSINSANSASGCTGDKVTLSATASAGTINWYTGVSGGTAIATGNSYTTPALTATTTYYVDAINNGCISNFRTPVTATINPIPSITGVTPASACGPASLTLGAAASAGTISWFAADTGGTAIQTGTTYTTPLLSSTTTYYVETSNNNCKSSPRTPVVAKIKPVPTITASTGASSCKPASLNLQASASSGTVRWYGVATGGPLLSTGNTFTTPLLSATTTYYADAIDSGCVSTVRTPVDATIYPSINRNTTLNGFTLSATATSVTYQWVDCNNGKQPITGATAQTYTPTKNGSYAVILKNANCTDTSDCVPYTKIGINTHNTTQMFSLSPNPAREEIVLHCDAWLTEQPYAILDVAGRTILTGKIHNTQETIALSALAPGVYLFMAGTEQRKYIRFVKE